MRRSCGLLVAKRPLDHAQVYCILHSNVRFHLWVNESFFSRRNTVYIPVQMNKGQLLKFCLKSNIKISFLVRSRKLFSLGQRPGDTQLGSFPSSLFLKSSLALHLVGLQNLVLCLPVTISNSCLTPRNVLQDFHHSPHKIYIR